MPTSLPFSPGAPRQLVRRWATVPRRKAACCPIPSSSCRSVAARQVHSDAPEPTPAAAEEINGPPLETCLDAREEVTETEVALPVDFTRADAQEKSRWQERADIAKPTPAVVEQDAPVRTGPYARLKVAQVEDAQPVDFPGRNARRRSRYKEEADRLVTHARELSAVLKKNDTRPVAPIVPPLEPPRRGMLVSPFQTTPYYPDMDPAAEKLREVERRTNASLNGNVLQALRYSPLYNFTAVTQPRTSGSTSSSPVSPVRPSPTTQKRSLSGICKLQACHLDRSLYVAEEAYVPATLAFHVDPEGATQEFGLEPCLLADDDTPNTVRNIW